MNLCQKLFQLTLVFLSLAFFSQSVSYAQIDEAIDGFDYPIEYQTDNFGYRFLGEAHNVKLHPGTDWNGIDDRFGDFPVFAVADGEIADLSDVGKNVDGWGGVIIIKHNYKGEVIYSQYGHVIPIKRVVKSDFQDDVLVQKLLEGKVIKEDRINPNYVYFGNVKEGPPYFEVIDNEDKLKESLEQIGISETDVESILILWENSYNIKKGDKVNKGDQIAIIHPNPGWPPHLHFEIRNSNHEEPEVLDSWMSDSNHQTGNERWKMFLYYEEPKSFIMSHGDYSEDQIQSIVVDSSVTFDGKPNKEGDPISNFIDNDSGILTIDFNEHSVNKYNFFQAFNLNEFNVYPDGTDDPNDGDREAAGENRAFGGNFHWVETTDTEAATAEGIWYFRVLEAGYYRVEVNIPKGPIDNIIPSTTKKAVYEIFHNGEIHHSTPINQDEIVSNNLDERWVSIGMWYFSPEFPSRIKLCNNTGETGEKIAFDAIRLNPAGPIDTAISKGLQYLRDQQLTNGSWSNDPAVTSLAVLAMLNAGYDEGDSVVADGIQYIISKINTNPDGSVHSVSGRYTYYTSIAILPLVATHNPDYHDEIIRMRNWLIGSQWDEACFYGSVNESHWYYGGFGYGYSVRPDLSNTQWALMGLKAADKELDTVACDSYKKVLIFLERCLNSDGGSSYVPNHSYGSIHTMTAASVWSHSICNLSDKCPEVEQDKVTDGVDSGIQWLSDRYSVTNNDGWGARFEYYYAVTLAKALVMSHKTKLGTHDWFEDLAGHLIDKQNQTDGNWPYTGLGGLNTQGDKEMNTCWSILSLQTRTLPANVDVSMSMILASHADLHVYDPQGKHMGVNYQTMMIEENIPGATFRILDADGNEVPYDGQTPDEGLRQVVTLPLLVAGSYRIELVGTSDGPFHFTINGQQDGEIVTTHTYEGEVATGEELATSVTVTTMEGSMTLLYEPLSVLPILGLSPSQIKLVGEPDAAQNLTFTVSEVGGQETLHSVSIYCTDIIGSRCNIPGSQVIFDVNNFDIAPGGDQVVNASIPVPSGFAGLCSGAIVVESADGGTKSITLMLDLDTDSDEIGNTWDNCPNIANTEQIDNDSDGVGNECDNCPDTPNPDQADTDSNGIGDICEEAEEIPCDLNNDGVVGFSDLAIVTNCFGQDPAACDPRADVNGDGAVNILDVSLVVSNFTPPS
jgi:murein DD-endopeptidase MepM/ murein hydrolase activator NlpD